MKIPLGFHPGDVGFHSALYGSTASSSVLFGCEPDVGLVPWNRFKAGDV